MTNGFLWITAVALGLRHGLDFDHVAAIADLVGSRVTDTSAGSTKAVTIGMAKFEPCWLAAAYALGHAAVVALLGLSALMFRAILPPWIDPLMEKVVGLTLIFLGAWMFYCLTRSTDDLSKPVLQSRGMLFLSALSVVKRRICSMIFSRDEPVHTHSPAQVCDCKCAASIGALHAIGAETGTQVRPHVGKLR